MELDERSPVELGAFVVNDRHRAAELVAIGAEGDPVRGIGLHLHEVPQANRVNLGFRPLDQPVVGVARDARRVEDDVRPQSQPSGRRLPLVLEVRVVAGLRVVADRYHLSFPLRLEAREHEAAPLHDRHERLDPRASRPGIERLESHIAVEEAPLALDRVAQLQPRVAGEAIAQATQIIGELHDRAGEAHGAVVVLRVVHEPAADLIPIIPERGPRAAARCQQ